MATVSLKAKLDTLPKKRRAAIERRAEAIVAEAMTLAQLRKALGMTQEELAAKRGMKQAGIARLEKQSEVLLSTLREHVEAMGGRLDLVASFPDREPVKVELRDVADAGPRGP